MIEDVDTTQKIEIYFNFIGEYIPPTMAEKEPTPEELEEMRKKEARKDRLHQNYLKRKANGKQKEYEERTKAKKKVQIESQSAITGKILRGSFRTRADSRTGNKGRKPDTISLSQEFFDGADIDIEIKAKVIYESDKDNIINEYIVFCKVFNEQIKEHGMTKQAVTETIRICKDRNILKQYLSSKEVEVVTIMMSLFDDEQIMRTYAKDIEKETERKTAEKMIKMGKLSLEEISLCVPTLSFDELKELEAEVMQLA